MKYKIDGLAKFIGYKTDKNGKERWQGAVPAILNVNNVRFFSLAPRDKEDEERINKALNDSIKELTTFFNNEI